MNAGVLGTDALSREPTSQASVSRGRAARRNAGAADVRDVAGTAQTVYGTAPRSTRGRGGPWKAALWRGRATPRPAHDGYADTSAWTGFHSDLSARRRSYGSVRNGNFKLKMNKRGAPGWIGRLGV